MNRTVLAVIVLAVILAIFGFLFYDGASDGETVVDKADQATPPSAPGGAPAPNPNPAP